MDHSLITMELGRSWELTILVPSAFGGRCNLVAFFSLLFLRMKYVKNVQFQKISILPPTEGGGGRVGGSVRPKNLKKCMKLSWNFQRDGGVLEKSLP